MARTFTCAECGKVGWETAFYSPHCCHGCHNKAPIHFDKGVHEAYWLTQPMGYDDE